MRTEMKRPVHAVNIRKSTAGKMTLYAGAVDVSFICSSVRRNVRSSPCELIAARPPAGETHFWHFCAMFCTFRASFLVPPSCVLIPSRIPLFHVKLGFLLFAPRVFRSSPMPRMRLRAFSTFFRPHLLFCQVVLFACSRPRAHPFFFPLCPPRGTLGMDKPQRTCSGSRDRYSDRRKRESLLPEFARTYDN